MKPVLIKIFGLPIHSYGFMLAVAFFVGIFIAKREGRKNNLAENDILDLSLWIMLGGIVGARLIYVILNFSEFSKDLASIILPRAGGIGGLSFHGGIIGGLLGGYLFTRKRKLNFPFIADVITPSLAIGLMFGRIGCFLNGCCYGKICKLAIGVKFPELPGYRHPTQIYEALGALTIFILLNYLKKFKKFSGELFLYFLVLYSIVRGGVEIFRAGETGKYLIYPLTQAQVLSILIIIIALPIIFIKRKKLNLKNAKK